MSVPGNLYTPTIRKTRGGDYLIEQSLLFNDDDSAYLNRTPSTVGNRKTWTFSVWVKRGDVGTTQYLFDSYNAASDRSLLIFTSTDKLRFLSVTSSSNVILLEPARVFRDPSAWYHIVLVSDTSNATAGNRTRIYINGVEETVFTTDTQAPLNHDTWVNSTNVHDLGKYGGASSYFDGLMALPILVDGAALDPTSFGEEDDDGYWNPIEFAGASSTTQFTTDIGTQAQHIDNAAASGEANLYDGDGDAFSDPAWSSGVNPDTNDAWLGQDFGSGVTKTIRQVTIYQNNSSGGTNYLTDWDLQYSDNGSTWTLAESYTGLSGTALSEDLTHDGSAGAHRYWRLIARSDAASGSGTVIREIEWYEVEDTTSATNGFGTNGFVMDFSDTSNFGDDTSGNGNDYTSNNFTASDQLSDTPTDSADDEIGNFARLNSLTGTPNWVFSNNNLTVTNATESNHRLAYATQAVTSGKWYWEVTISSAPNVDSIGVINMDIFKDGVSAYLSTYGAGWGYSTSVGRWDAGGGWISAGAAPPALTASGVIGIALDCDNNKLWFRNASGWINSGDPAAGTGANFTRTTTVPVAPAFSKYNNSGAYTFNFGLSAFTYTPPTGFETNFATQNLPAPTIADGSDYFNTVLWTGNGTSQDLDFGFPVDMFWAKCRSTATSHQIHDVVRGGANVLYPNATSAEVGGQSVTFDSVGVNFGSDGGINTSGRTYVGWGWKAGGTGSSDSTGNITVTRSTNATAGFSIVTGTGNSGSGANFGHGFTSPVHFGIFKNRDSAQTWYVYHKDLVATENVLHLDTDAAASVQSSIFGTSSSSQFYLDGGGVNAGTDDWVGYLWTGVEDFSKFGTYAANGSADGPFVYTGFTPAWIMIKGTTHVSNWNIIDISRATYNPADRVLRANLVDSDFDGTSSDIEIDFLSNGFKIRGGSGANDINQTSQSYIYVAFAEVPFQGDDGYTQARAR